MKEIIRDILFSNGFSEDKEGRIVGFFYDNELEDIIELEAMTNKIERPYNSSEIVWIYRILEDGVLDGDESYSVDQFLVWKEENLKPLETGVFRVDMDIRVSSYLDAENCMTSYRGSAYSWKNPRELVEQIAYDQIKEAADLLETRFEGLTTSVDFRGITKCK